MNVLMDKSGEETALSSSWARFIVLGLGLLYLGRQQEAEVALEGMVVLPEAFQKFAKMLLDTCAYAGTGNVLKVQSLLHACSEHVDVEDDDAAPPLAPQPRRPVFDALALEDPDRNVLAAWWQRTRPGGPPSPPWSSTT